MGLGPESKLVGMVAFMYRPKRYLGHSRGIKGHEDLIDALAICVERDPNVCGVFIGGAYGNAVRYEAQVREYAEKRLGARARFLGVRNDVRDLYPDFDVAVHPSHSENLGGAAESLDLAVPTIATRVGGFPDLIEHGETGWLVPPKVPRELAEAIMTALADPVRARALAVKGQAKVHEILDVKKTAREVFALYGTILGECGQPVRAYDSRPRASRKTRVEMGMVDVQRNIE